MMSVIDRSAKIAFLYSLRHILPYLPHRILHAFAESSAWATYVFDKGKVNAIKQEMGNFIEKKYSEKELNALVRRSLSNLRKNHFETWTYTRLNQRKIRKMTQYVGKEHVDEAIAKGKGGIILVAHFGAYKYVLPALAHEGYKINQMGVKPTFWKNGSFIHDKVMEIEFESETMLPVNFIYLEKSLRPVFKALLNNEIVVMSMDGLVGDNRFSHNFFNHHLHFVSTPILLSRRIGSPLIPTFIIRQVNNQHKIVFERPLSSYHEMDDDQAVSEAIGKCASMLEKYYLEYPCHYTMFLMELRKRKLIYS